MRGPLLAFCFLGLLCSASAWELNYSNCVQPVYNMANWVHFKFTGIMHIFRLGSEPDPYRPDPVVPEPCAELYINYDDKLRRIGKNNDRDGDGVVSMDDIIWDVKNNYDKDNDNQWTERECVTRNTCNLGDTSLKATFACNGIMGGQTSIDIDVLRTSYPSFNLRRKCGAVCYIYCSNGNILNQDGCPTCQCRDQAICANNGVSSCEYGSVVDAQGCPTGQCNPRGGMDLKDFIIMNRNRYLDFAKRKCLNKCLNDEERVELIARRNDLNGDGLVTVQEIRQYLLANQDANKDGMMSEDEWVKQWICEVGDSAEYAKFMWRDNNWQDPIDLNTLTSIPGFGNGLSVAEFKERQRQRYARFTAASGRKAQFTPCTDGQAGCAPRALTLDEKVAINRRNDKNGDGVFDRAEATADIKDNYDLNGDGIISEQECVSRVECAFGESTPVARYQCNLMLRGQPSISVNRYVSLLPSTNVSTAVIDQLYRQQVAEYTNRGCERRCLSLTEKLDKNAANNDRDRDGLVTVPDLRNDVRISFRTAEDGVFTQNEFVDGWMCHYGDSADFARFFWGNLFFGNDQRRDLNDLPPEYNAGVPEADWRAGAEGIYRKFADLYPNSALNRPCRD